jgi:DNA-binding CsgD family transcriptional regulator
MPGASEESVLSTVHRIYEAIEGPELWPKTIHAIGELIGGRRNFWGLDLGTQFAFMRPAHATDRHEAGCHGTFFLSRADLQALDRYAEEFGELIIRFLKIVFLSILRSQHEFSAREAIGVKMVQRYLDAFEPVPAKAGLLKANAAGRKLIAALWDEGRVFGADSLRCMRLLLPHLDRAVRLEMRLNTTDLHRRLVSGALDYLTYGVVLVDSSGAPLYFNKRAHEIMDESDDLRLSSTGLSGRRPAETRSFRELIQEAVSDGMQGILAVNRAEGLRPLLLIAAPLSPNGGMQDGKEAVGGVVFISDPERSDNPTVESLKRAFDLTYREAQTAIAIADGHGLQAAADAMGVALTTARSQLQQAFAKTGTSHQAELAALVHRTLTHIRYN